MRIFGSGSGTLLAATRDIGTLPSSLTLAELGDRRPTLFVAASQDEADRLYAAQPVVAPGGTTLAVVEVSRSVAEMRTLLSTLRLVLLLSGAVALAAVLMASLLSGTEGHRPAERHGSGYKGHRQGRFRPPLAGWF